MWQKERHQRISNLLDVLERVPIERLIEELQVSRETVRRDLLEMERLGVLKRVHGGVIPVGRGSEPSLDVRSQLHVQEKRDIAKLARGLLSDCKVIFVDAGSTTTELARELAVLYGLHIITNSIDVARILGRPKDRGAGANLVTMLGGNLDKTGEGTEGDVTIREINRHFADIAILSPAALNVKYGAMSASSEEADVARSMVENAKACMILADHGKIGQMARVSYCLLPQIDYLIVDRRVPQDDTFNEIKKKVRQTIIAK